MLSNALFFMWLTLNASICAEKKSNPQVALYGKDTFPNGSCNGVSRVLREMIGRGFYRKENQIESILHGAVFPRIFNLKILCYL